MNRRQAVKRVALLMGGALSASTIAALSTGCNAGKHDHYSFSDANTATMLDEIAETIIPQTDTPGAKAANVGPFMAMMLQDCYTKDDQKIFLDGIADIDKKSQKKYNKYFLELTPKQREAVLTDIDKERVAYNMKKKEDNAPPHYFQLMKELTLLGYFTSKPGATETLRYVAIPGRYDGCVDYHKGDKAWAT